LHSAVAADEHSASVVIKTEPSGHTFVAAVPKTGNSVDRMQPVGCEDGAVEGSDDGRSLGAEEGFEDGAVEGSDDGRSLGADEGFEDGAVEGSKDGWSAQIGLASECGAPECHVFQYTRSFAEYKKHFEG